MKGPQTDVHDPWGQAGAVITGDGCAVFGGASEGGGAEAIHGSKTVQGWRDAIPLKRGGHVNDVANLAVFLASDMSAYITGQTINVCGGMLT